MKIIISHDVDHLEATDHICRDLILEKLWIRSFIHMCRGWISPKTFIYRLTILFHNRMHRIHELIDFDRKHGIPSVFFFGMDKKLGMSYQRKKTVPIIRFAMDAGFDVGVHGVDYQDTAAIMQEHTAFCEISGMKNFGVRNHYVRFNEETFIKMAKAGYIFDSTWFNKKRLEIRGPYKVNNMWEFPLHIMDVYICKPGFFEKGIRDTQEAVKQAEAQGMPYCTILFHDYQFDERYDPDMKRWYVETIQWLEEQGYEFISYRDAIKEMEGRYS